MSQDPKDLLRACAESLLNAVSHLENRTTSQQASTQATSQVTNSSSVTESRKSVIKFIKAKFHRGT
jgi:hypothetical protein